MVTAPLLEVAAVTPRSRLLVIDTSRANLAFSPGQAVLIGWHGHAERRPYSIACSPEAAADSGRLELLIALDAPGDVSAHLADARAGTLVDVDGPLGTFVF